MPNLPAHIDFAYETARRLGNDNLDANLGYFFLGSTSPDIKIITRKRREDYHFATLDFESPGAGVDGLFRSHPHLVSASDHDGPTQAFVAGYITHLVSDEAWIVDMFRPFFGNSDVFEDDVRGNVMDRALQLELDRRAFQAAGDVSASLEAATDGVGVGFISSETLADWRKWVLSFMERGFSWDRLRFMARRVAGGDEGHPAHLVAAEFLDSMPGSLERLCQMDPRCDLAAFKDRTVQTLVRAVGDYLK